MSTSRTIAAAERLFDLMCREPKGETSGPYPASVMDFGDYGDPREEAWPLEYDEDDYPPTIHPRHPEIGYVGFLGEWVDFDEW